MSPRPSLLFVNQHYWPDHASTGQHLTDLAEYLVVRGYDVTVLCSKGKYAGGGRLEVKDEEERNGVRIVRLSGTGFGRTSRLGRITDYATFLARVQAWLLRGPKHDLVVLLTTPSLLGVAGWITRGLRRQPYAVWSMDVHPDVEDRLGALPSGTAKPLRLLGDRSYRKAEFVVALGEHMKEVLLNKGVAEERLRVIPVWNRRDEIEPVAKQANPLVSDLGVENRFVVMYSGNAGLAHRFEEVLSAIERTTGESDLEWVFAGDGPRKREIVERVGDVWNFRYLGYWPREMLKYSLSVGDVHLVTLRDEMAGLVVPGKLYGIMAAGRPVVFVGPRRSDTARTIEREGIGYVVDPADEGMDATDRLVKVLLDLRTDPEERRRMGRRARDAFLESHERNVACARWERAIREALAGGGNGAAPDPEREAG